jgi:SAM-dependent methyltransferase
MPISVQLPPRAAYALWADVYPAAAHNPLMQTEQLVASALIASLQPRRALDVGTGSGRYLSILAAAGASTVIGVDFSREMLARVAVTPSRRVCADARRLPFGEDAFDLVNASLMAGDIADLPAWLREMARVLEPGGHLVYSDFHPTWAAHGWRRTFEARDGHTIDLPYAPHSLNDHVTALEQAPLNLLACYELPLADGGPPVDAFREQWGNPPVVVVVFARKAPCGGA